MLTSSEIEQHTKEFLARGGAIQKIPMGMIAQQKGTKKQKQKFHLTEEN